MVWCNLTLQKQHCVRLEWETAFGFATVFLLSPVSMRSFWGFLQLETSQTKLGGILLLHCLGDISSRPPAPRTGWCTKERKRSPGNTCQTYFHYPLLHPLTRIHPKICSTYPSSVHFLLMTHVSEALSWKGYFEICLTQGHLLRCWGSAANGNGRRSLAFGQAACRCSSHSIHGTGIFTYIDPIRFD